jgi:predicted ATP-dependent serine protease
MCLEDSYRRVRRRIDQLDEVATKNLHFLNSAPLLGNGLEELIEGHVQLFPNTSLVIIDTLQMVRGTEVGTYFRDYADMQVFKKLADKLGTTILLVHHTRKSGDDNPFNTISGSTGLTGAVDGSFVLVRDEKRPRYYKLAVTGRDIEQRELTLVFDTTYCLWETVSCDAEIVLDVKEPPEIFFAVCDYIKSIGSFEGSASELLAALDDDITPANMLTKTLNKHREQLAENKILYEYHRTNSKKFIELAYCA